jgi:DNA-directed RNA polymerase subunit RPC12/RpoP
VGARVIYVLAAGLFRSLNPEPPGEPDPGELHPVDLKYRCIVCGAEVTMTSAPGDEMPEAPRHCKEDMALVVEAGSD